MWSNKLIDNNRYKYPPLSLTNRTFLSQGIAHRSSFEVSDSASSAAGLACKGDSATQQLTQLRPHASTPLGHLQISEIKRGKESDHHPGDKIDEVWWSTPQKTIDHIKWAFFTLCSSKCDTSLRTDPYVSHGAPIPLAFPMLPVRALRPFCLM